MALRYRDTLARQLVQTLKHEPRYHDTVKQVHNLPRPITVETFPEKTRFYSGAYESHTIPIGVQNDPAYAGTDLEGIAKKVVPGVQPPYIEGTLKVERVPGEMGSTLAHEMTHALHEHALEQGDRKAISLERTAPPYDLDTSGNYGRTAEETVARLGQDPSVPPPPDAPQYIRRMGKLLRNLRHGDLNPVRDPAQIEQVPGEPRGPDTDQWTAQYLTNRAVRYPMSLNTQPSEQSWIGRLAQVLVGTPTATGTSP